ncbi:MAG: DUF2075 domain-containing protein [Actinobacteria bacterium]|nr:DUF2075 domain-containing protein [Actinomycetota bacterium]
MLAYVATKRKFLDDAPQIEDLVRDAVFRHLNLKVGKSEYEAWRNSLGNAMFHVMNDPEIHDDAGIAVEYRLNGRRFRIDFMITGHDRSGNPQVVIVELKQWTEIQLSDTPNHVITFLGGSMREERHPSYQAWSYQSHLELYNEFIYTNQVEINSCSYLHNCTENKVVSSSRYEELLSKSPVFIKGDHTKLRQLVKDRIHSGIGTNIIEDIEKSPIRPSKQLADAVGNMLEGQEEFVLLDEQRTVYEKIIKASLAGLKGKKQVLIIKGGPGTGKSVISMNALAELTKRRLNARYVTPNGAPRAVYESKLKDRITGDAFRHMFTGSGAFHKVEKDVFEVLIVDEAHRLSEKSGFYKNEGENQIKEIIHSAKTSVFFIDEAQKVTWSDIGEIEEIKRFATDVDADIQEYELVSQFRCGGSDDYLEWVDFMLGIKASNQLFSLKSFDFRVFDNASELHAEIRKRNEVNNKSRVVAGYCWNWISKKDSRLFDIQIPNDNYKARWNLSEYGNNWIIDKDSINEVGCIHTCQGLEVDYVGVIFGEDLRFEGGQLITDPAKRAKTDQSLKGFKKQLASEPIIAEAKADELIRNTYRTLMSRGMKGCYIYAVDEKTREYFRNAVNALPKG